MVFAVGRREGALGAEVVLHVAGALHRARVLRALELAEDLAVGLARDVGEHVQAAAVRHADGDLVEAGLGGALQDLVEQGDGRLAALEAEPLLADVLGLQEGLERLGLVEACRGCASARRGRACCTASRPCPGSTGAGPGPGCACTRCRSCGSTSRGGCRGSRAAAPCGVPPKPPVTNSRSRSQKVRPWLEMSRSGCERCLYSSGSMSAIRWPRTRNALMSSCTRAVLSMSLGGVDVDVGGPVDRVVRDAQRREDVLVEAVLADEELVDQLEELAGAGALDHAVVVRAGRG